jgi:uncharacterized protein (DUF4415 family)
LTERRRNIEQERAYNSLMMELGELERWLSNDRLKDRLIPPDWHRIEREVPVRRKKTMLTARYDADLVKWFRGMGQGYQSRMNAVLRAFMLAVVSKEILSRGDKDWKGDPIWGLPAKKEK